MKILCRGQGGSHAYGLNTPESDLDERGVFINDTLTDIFNVTSEEHVVRVNEEEDTALFELRKFVKLLNKGNTGALEILFGDNTEVDEGFKMLFVDERRNFLDSNRLYKCLRGYAMGEYNLAIGKRVGVIGHKRHEQLKKYGFSPKNFTQLFRLLHVGKLFFDTGEFIVNCRTGFDLGTYEFLMEVKTEPWKFTQNQLAEEYKKREKLLDIAYENRKETFLFDWEYVQHATVAMYLQELKITPDMLRHAEFWQEYILGLKK
jgi:hypothetical protein